MQQITNSTATCQGGKGARSSPGTPGISHNSNCRQERNGHGRNTNASEWNVASGPQRGRRAHHHRVPSEGTRIHRIAPGSPKHSDRRASRSSNSDSDSAGSGAWIIIGTLNRSRSLKLQPPDRRPWVWADLESGTHPAAHRQGWGKGRGAAGAGSRANQALHTQRAPDQEARPSIATRLHG